MTRQAATIIARNYKPREAAIRIAHRAWWEVSGEPGPVADRASAILAHVKRYLMRPGR